MCLFSFHFGEFFIFIFYLFFFCLHQYSLCDPLTDTLIKISNITYRSVQKAAGKSAVYIVKQTPANIYICYVNTFIILKKRKKNKKKSSKFALKRKNYLNIQVTLTWFKILRFLFNTSTFPHVPTSYICNTLNCLLETIYNKDAAVCMCV